MLVFFFPFFENLASHVYDSMRALVRFCFWKASAQRFFRWEVVRPSRARALAVHACPPRAQGRPRRRLLLSRPLGGSAAKWTIVVWPIKRRQTDKPTNQQINTHYSFIGIDVDKTPWNIYTEDTLQVVCSWVPQELVSTNGLPVPAAPCWSTDCPNLPSIFLYQT